MGGIETGGAGNAPAGVCFMGGAGTALRIGGGGVGRPGGGGALAPR